MLKQKPFYIKINLDPLSVYEVIENRCLYTEHSIIVCIRWSFKRDTDSHSEEYSIFHIKWGTQRKISHGRFYLGE